MRTALMKYAARQLSQPSTWAGIAVIATALGVPRDKMDAATSLGMGIAGAVAAFLP